MTESATYIDWDTARRTGQRLVKDGPRISPAQAQEAVEELHDAAVRAHAPVAATARLGAGDETARQAPVFVVDRTAWIDVNAASMGALVQPALEKVASAGHAGRRARAVGARISGAEAGALLGFVASRVLGQYDLAPDGTPSLLLVAPNIVQVEQELAVDPSDFRLWVCLHEETHRVQFTAVPWLREHMIDRVRALMTDMVPEPSELGRRLREMGSRLPAALDDGGSGLADLVGSPEQRAEMARITAVMSLLEGHADVVMDEVGPQVVPTVAHIRERFDARRKGARGPDRLLRRLLGLEAKMRQYRDGAVFVRTVVDEVGIDGFNAVWTSPDTLPLHTEIERPRDWIARVHG